MIGLLYAVVILAQVVYWLHIRPETERLAQAYYDACVYPGGKNV